MPTALQIRPQLTTIGKLADPRMPLPQNCVLRDVLERHARATPDRCFVTFENGNFWTFAQLLAKTRQAAAALQKLGVRQDDKVLLWMPNGAEALRIWFAINYIGAVFVPINPVHRGRVLEHMIDNSGAQLMLAQASLIEGLECLQRVALRDVVSIGGLAKPIKGLTIHPAQVMDTHGCNPLQPARPIMPWDLQQVIYTSGTTGPSKGVMCSYLKAKMAEPAFDFLDANDRYLVNLPFFHVSGAAAVMDMLRRGGSVALVGPFSVSNFWSLARQSAATCCTLIGSMAQLLLNAADGPEDHQHGLRAVIILPLVASPEAFTKRFGCNVYTVFSMTEVASPIISSKNPTSAASCGRARTGVELRIVDENDCELAPGTIGELIVRSDIPWALSHGYLNSPQASAEAWRNGWFHTGDAFRCDEEGNYFFIDRMKDTIRRRGENISSFEVEVEVAAHPKVREVAAYAVPDPLGGDEVMVAVCLNEGAVLDWPELLNFLSLRMARFMVPRYLRRVHELPKTSTQKVQKLVLRAEGVTADTFDRVAAGFDLTVNAALAQSLVQIPS
jgi:crotonobetaine/carnitine-CoA ligase